MPDNQTIAGQMSPNFFLEIDREDAYASFAQGIGKTINEMTVAEMNIAIARRVILNGMAMLETAIFYSKEHDHA